MPDRRLVGRILALSFACAALVPGQTPPFAFVKDQIPAEAGPVLGLADFDLDGDQDLLTNNTGIYLNDGNGNFTPHPVLSAVTAGSGPWNGGVGQPVAIGDVNGDLYPDVISFGSDNPASGPHYIRKWINLGNGALVSFPLTVTGGTSPGFPPRAFAIADVDLDGDRDVVVSYGNTTFGWSIPPPPPMSLWLNSGTGAFIDASTQLPATPAMPPNIVLHDMDADGDLDLVCSGESYGPNWVLQGPQLIPNLGGGLFGTPIALSAPSSHDCFAIGDFDGDGLPDLVFASSPRSSDCSPATPVVLRNTGGGTFATLAATAAGTSRAWPQLLDADGDGADELVLVAAEWANLHSVGASAVGPSIAAFPAGLGYGLNSTGSVTSVIYAATGDLDGDGDRDLVVYSGQRNRALFNDSIGHLVAAPSSLEAPFGWNGPGPTGPVDVDGDGDLDLMLPSGACFNAGTAPAALRVALNDSTGSLVQTPSIPCVGCQPSSLWGPRVAFDADADGDQDLCLASYNWTPAIPITLEVAINSGGVFSSTQSLSLGLTAGVSTAYGMKAGDLDGDGDLDVVVAGSTSAVLLNDGTGTLQVSTTLSPGLALVLVDVDSDADLDLVIGGSLFLNDGLAGFVPGAPLVPISTISGYGIEAADFDGDGDPDLLIGNTRFVNDGIGGFTAVAPLPPATPGSTFQGWYSAFDVDLDGFADVVNSQGLLYRNLGGTFAAPVVLPAPLLYPIVHADFDRDGDQDLVAVGTSILTNMTRQLSRGKPARPGRPASLEIAGSPGAPWLLFASNGTGNLPLPPLGTVFLDLGTAQLVYSGVLSPAGAATVSGTVPAGPAWVGVSVSWQAVIYGLQGPRLTGLETTTIANY